MNGRSTLARLGFVALLAGTGLAGCQSGTSSSSVDETTPTLQPVDETLATKAQNSCWFKVRNRTGRSEEVRLWNAVASSSAKTERLGQLLIVTGSMEPAVRDSRYYGCSLFEYRPGSPVVMMATDATLPVNTDNLIPYGFSRNGMKEIK